MKTIIGITMITVSTFAGAVGIGNDSPAGNGGSASAAAAAASAAALASAQSNQHQNQGQLQGQLQGQGQQQGLSNVTTLTPSQSTTLSPVQNTSQSTTLSPVQNTSQSTTLSPSQTTTLSPSQSANQSTTLSPSQTTTLSPSQSTSQSTSQSASQSTNTSPSQTLTVNEARPRSTVTIRNVPDAVAPSINPTARCLDVATGAFAVAGLGVSVGTTIKDTDCTRMEYAKTLAVLGETTAAVSLLCKSAEVAEALGPEKCPVKKVAAAAGSPACYRDEIVALRMNAPVCM